MLVASMTPNYSSEDGKPYLVIGSPGGRTFINTVFHNSSWMGLPRPSDLDRAIEAMKIHHSGFPIRFYYERNLLSPDTRDVCEKMGHTFGAHDQPSVYWWNHYMQSWNIVGSCRFRRVKDGAARGY